VGSKVIRNVTKILKATSGRLFGRVSNGTGRAEELTPSQARTVLELGTLATQSGTFSGTSSGTNTGDQNLFSTIVVAGQSDVVADATGDTLTLVAGTNISITTNAGSDSITINNTASGLSGTGSVDNAVLRADGTGGATLQNSAFVIDDLYTASPNNTVNFTCIKPTGGTTDVGVAIVPKGMGAFSLAVPNGAASGGNARGTNAADLQTNRNAATQVASGLDSFLGGGLRNTASGTQSAIVGGAQNVCSGIESFIGGGENCVVSGQFSSVVGGRETRATAQAALAFGFAADARLEGMFAHSSCPLNLTTSGESQAFRVTLGVLTTNATPTLLWVDRYTSVRLTVRSGYVMLAVVSVMGVKSDGTACAVYQRRVAIKNVAGTVSLVGTVETIGTDIEDNASTDIAITANDTNDCMDISVTGITSETWRWYSIVDGIEFRYGT
jgi:hypothetical protein